MVRSLLGVAQQTALAATLSEAHWPALDGFHGDAPSYLFLSSVRVHWVVLYTPVRPLHVRRRCSCEAAHDCLHQRQWTAFRLLPTVDLHAEPPPNHLTWCQIMGGGFALTIIVEVCPGAVATKIDGRNRISQLKIKSTKIDNRNQNDQTNARLE